MFLKITSSVLHYVVCFPGECRPPEDAAPARARGICGVVAGARSVGARPRDPSEGGGGRASGGRGFAPLALAVFREAGGRGGRKPELAGEEDWGPRGLLPL